MDMDDADNSYWGLCIEAVEPDVTVSMDAYGSPDAAELICSMDGGASWTAFDPDGGTTVRLDSAGDRVWFRSGPLGNDGLSDSDSDYRSFAVNGRALVHGSAASLLNGSGAYYAMRPYALSRLFEGCEGILSAPSLPTTRLSPHCYERMFHGCAALTAAPEALPAVRLREGCYGGMFGGCVSLQSAPEIRALSLAPSSCSGMFGGCTSLSSVAAFFTGWQGEGATDGWLQGVAESGVFRCMPVLGVSGAGGIDRGADRCPAGWEVVNMDAAYNAALLEDVCGAVSSADAECTGLSAETGRINPNPLLYADVLPAVETLDASLEGRAWLLLSGYGDYRSGHVYKVVAATPPAEGWTYEDVSAAAP